MLFPYHWGPPFCDVLEISWARVSVSTPVRFECLRHPWTGNGPDYGSTAHVHMNVTCTGPCLTAVQQSAVLVWPAALTGRVPMWGDQWTSVRQQARSIVSRLLLSRRPPAGSAEWRHAAPSDVVANQRACMWMAIWVVDLVSWKMPYF